MKHFHPFRLDATNRCLWRADARVPLSPKAFAVLCYLVEHRGRLLSQNELLDAAWRNLEVQPEILKKYILEIRKALGDEADAPVYIETLPRLGYRFIAEVQEAAAAPYDDAASTVPVRIVGRDPERAALRASLEQAAAGRGGVLCLSGGTGTGKTALAEEFLLETEARGAALILRGRCSEHVGDAEPYYPMWEAIEGLRFEHEGDLLRVPREFTALLQKLGALRPVVLFIDDLHWADAATVDLVAYLAGRLAASRILVVVTCRPAELSRTRHPFGQLKLVLQARGICREVRMAPLSGQ